MHEFIGLGSMNASIDIGISNVVSLIIVFIININWRASLVIASRQICITIRAVSTAGASKPIIVQYNNQ